MNKSVFTTKPSNIAIALVIAIFFVADRFLKMLSLAIGGPESVVLLPNWLYFNLTKNYYIAFSLPLSGLWLNLAITLLLLLIIIYLAHLILRRQTKRLEIFSLSLIILGAASNLFDRLTYGYVIDYLALHYFTVFNLADCLISLGAGLLILKNLQPNK
jgi:signal peptidase II